MDSLYLVVSNWRRYQFLSKARHQIIDAAAQRREITSESLPGESFPRNDLAGGSYQGVKQIEFRGRKINLDLTLKRLTIS